MASRDDVGDLVSSVASLLQAVEETQSEDMQELDSRFFALQSQLTVAQYERQLALNAVAGLQRENQSLKESLDESRSYQELMASKSEHDAAWRSARLGVDWNRQRASYDIQIDELTAQLASARKDNVELMGQNQHLAGEYASLRATTDGLRESIDELPAIIETLQEENLYLIETSEQLTNLFVFGKQQVTEIQVHMSKVVKLCESSQKKKAPLNANEMEQLVQSATSAVKVCHVCAFSFWVWRGEEEIRTNRDLTR